MKEPLRVPFEASEPDLAGPRLVHETGREDPNALPDLCEELREARTRGGYSISDAAHVLRIQEHYLEALEEGRFDRIPGTTYTIGFLRSYSGFLGLDPDEIVESFKREQGLNKGEQRLAFPSPTDTSPKPKFWLILLVLVLAGLAYGGWQYQSTGGTDRNGPGGRCLGPADRSGRHGGDRHCGGADRHEPDGHRSGRRRAHHGNNYRGCGGDSHRAGCSGCRGRGGACAA